ncbi:MAG: 2'-5' RNA ligase family protein [Gemmatimonadetes bacterium]|nr:2'-5' RNA ligase family protein [Gemmatimonadota bacterium]
MPPAAQATPTRVQLSLYVPPAAATILEAVRRRVDPVQARLIPAHVTLCREDELAGLAREVLAARCAEPGRAPLTLLFGRPETFHGHGIQLPCIAGEPAYHALRQRLLGGGAIRHAEPHLTLAHPRNPKVPGDTLAIAQSLPEGLSLTFDVARLIEQEPGAPWRVLAAFPLGAPPTS